MKADCLIKQDETVRIPLFRFTFHLTIFFCFIIFNIPVLMSKDLISRVFENGFMYSFSHDPDAIDMLFFAVLLNAFLLWPSILIVAKRNQYYIEITCEGINSPFFSAKQIPFSQLECIYLGQLPIVVRGITLYPEAIGIKHTLDVPPKTFKFYHLFQCNIEGAHEAIMSNWIDMDGKRFAELIAERANVPILDIPKQ